MFHPLLWSRRFSMRRLVCSRKFHSVSPRTARGIKERLPSTFADSEPAVSAVAITDPFLVYQSYVRSGKLVQDECQLRVMKEFQKLYYRLMDYKPNSDSAVKNSLLIKKLKVLGAEEQRQRKDLSNEPIRKFGMWFRKDFDVIKRDVVRYMTDEEELYNMPSPQGLLVNGEVGCGKSMLMDIFASSLPHHSKMRWHYNNFILWVFAEIHQIQKERFLTASVPQKHDYTMENEFILYEIAQKMIHNSTVFMLDEFMLPDVASAQIIRILFTYYFKLGGVLVATSNKLPEELYSSGFNKRRFESFIGVLHSRCVTVDMNSKFDYRRHFADVSSVDKHIVVKENNPIHDRQWNKLLSSKALGIDSCPSSNRAFDPDDLDWKPAELCVYNRISIIPKTFKQEICWLTFDHICAGLFSSSDYITLASTYKIFIIDHVPVMSTKMKNEARRFIALLDAIYEARCQLFLRTAVVPESMFFPEDTSESTNSEVVQQEEMYAKTAMQTLNPYRPNVTSYDQEYAKAYGSEEAKLREATNFGDVKAFTGEDEKFAFKRAVSRIYEMVGSDNWRQICQWAPSDESMRPWERQDKSIIVQGASRPASHADFLVSAKDIKKLKISLKRSLPRDVSAQLSIPFALFNRGVSPGFSSTSHFWGLGEWTIDQQKKIKDKIAQAWVGGVSRKK